MNVSDLKKLGHRAVLKTRKHSPEILVGLGIAGFVGTVALAIKATTNLDNVLFEADSRLQVVKKHYPEDKKALVKVYSRNVYEVTKLYLPTATLLVGSAGCVLGAHGIIKQRNVALVAAYNVLDSAFGQYRERVAEEIGVDKERDIRLGLREEKVTQKETGKTTKVVSLSPNGQPSPYARIFEKGATHLWASDPATNLAYIRAQQNWFNDLLVARGYVFLNDVYEALGFERTQAGQVVGWVSSTNEGDNYVDFGIYDFTDDRKRAFLNGLENAVLLDFNVDGNIWDKI